MLTTLEFFNQREIVDLTAEIISSFNSNGDALGSDTTCRGGEDFCAALAVVTESPSKIAVSIAPVRIGAPIADSSAPRPCLEGQT
jgi:hypothetical protein